MADGDTSRDVAIIGMACRFAQADDIEAFWTNLVDGRQCFGAIPSDRWDHEAFVTDRFRENDKTYVTRGAFIEDVDSFGAIHFGIAPRRVEVMDPQHRMVLETTRVALLDAGIEHSRDDLEAMGTFLGVSTSEYRNLITSRTLAMLMATGKLGDDAGVGEALSKSVENVAPISAFSMPGTLLNMAAANVANHYKLGGPAFTVDAACASSLLAVHDAVTQIRAGVCKTAVAGGVYLNLTPEAIIGFSRIGAISQKGECRPFDAEADGFLQGDGCGVVVLKGFDEAVDDGDRIYAVIRGSSANNDAGESSGPMAPSLEGQRRAVRAAFRDADVDPRTVGFVSCHGTATPVGDPVEVNAIRDVVAEAGEVDHKIMLGSVKANIGHTMSAAGVAGLIHATLSLHKECITPQAGFENPHPKLGLEEGPIAVPKAAIAWERGEDPRRAGVSAFGFGGTNCHIVLEEAPVVESATSADPHAVVLRADSRILLADYAEQLAQQLDGGEVSLPEVAYTLSVTRSKGAARLGVVARDPAELAKTLRRAAPQLRGEPAPGAILGPDAFFGEGDAPAVAFMFPGQGAQRVGLFRELADRYPAFAAHLHRFGQAAEPLLGAPIEDFLYPDVADDDAEARLTATEVCQPVMAAIGLALAAFLRDLGVEPAVCFGHSLGEFVAAGAGGMLSDEDAVRFVAERGRLMAQMQTEDFGSMAAVMAPAEDVRPFLIDGVQLANLNHPLQTVVSGSTDAVDRLATALTEAGIKATTLRVSHAFHSDIVAPVKPGLAEVVAKLDLGPATTPVVSAITAQPYGDVDAARSTFVEHTTSPVDFMGALKTALDLGVSLFIEVGAGTTLTSFAQGTLAEQLLAARSLGARESDDGREFQRTIALLAAAGVAVNFEKLYPQRRVASVVAPPLARSTHWAIRDKKVPLAVPESSKRGENVSNDSTKNANADLVALFREQNEILRQHAAIIAAQAAALGGQPTPGLELPTVSPATAVEETVVTVDASPVLAPAAASAPADAASEDYGALVRDAVAAVSAFPPDALSDDQQLALELGFDSLMFVDLASDLQKRIPGLEIPQNAFDQSTTIGDVIAFLQENAGDGSADEAVDEADGELHRYEVDWAPAPAVLGGARFAPKGLVAITTNGVDEQASMFAQTLEARGVRTHLVDLDDAADLNGATALVDFAHRDLGWEADHVVQLRRLAAKLLASGSPEAFVTVTSTADAATRGAVRGFTKAIAREWPATRALNVQVDDEVASMVIRELDQPTAYNEVRWTDGLREVPRAVLADNAGRAGGVDANDVVVISGGGKGIGKACAKSLVATGAKLVVVGRSKRGDLSDLGENASYVSWDVAKERPDAFAGISPTVVIHAAGVIRDAAVEKKSDKDVRTVVGVKVDGLRNLLAAAGDSVKTVVGFGSWAGRFGNVNQTDYAAANDAMTEIIRELAASGITAVNIDWPVWEGSTMGESIPESLRDAMRGRGVTFVGTDEGVAAFGAELGGKGTGEVIFARSLPGREAPFHAQFEASVELMPYVGDHVVRGVPIVPFAGALDWLATAAVAAGDAEALVLRDVQVFQGLDLSKPRTITLDANIERRRGTAEIHTGGQLAYRAKIEVPATPPTLALPTIGSDGVTPQLDLENFYAEKAFHGPLIRSITKIEGIAPNWIVGMVKTSTPARLLGRETDARWTVDPLVIDGAMQLVLYHLQSLHGFGAIPMQIDEYTQLRPFQGEWVRCSMALDEMADGNIVGTIAFEDERGLAALMTRLRAKEFHLESSDEDTGIDIDPQYWDIAQWPEVQELEQRLQMADLIGIRNPYFWPHDGPARNTAIVDGREMINYSSYNYCGFSGHPEVSKAAQDAVARYGTSVSASRIASGQIPLHQELEDAIADFIGTEATLVFAAGHMTNETCIGHVFGKKDLIIHDSLAHNSILTGAELSGAKRMSFPHNDWEALDRTLTKLRGSYEKVGIFIEGVYSMDGDIPELQKFIDVKRKHKCLLYVDEAHSMGVIGSRGAGIADYFGIDPKDVDIWMGTLSKSFASCGGYITGSKQLINYLKYTAPAFVFSAGISPANAAAALASCKLLSTHPEIPQTLQKRAAYFLELCRQHGIDTGMSKDSAVVPAIVGNSLDCLKLSARLADRGINVQPIVYPAVEDESSRLRFFLSAVHTEENLRQTVEILAEELANVRSGAAAE